MKTVNAVQPMQCEQEGTSNKYEWLWKRVYGLFNDHCPLNVNSCEIPEVRAWRPQVSSVSLLLTVGRRRAEKYSLDPMCTGSTRDIRWRWLYYAATHVAESVLHGGLILLCSTTSPETYVFKYLPQIKITINAYSSGWRLSIAMPTLFCKWAWLFAHSLALRLPSCRCKRGKMVQKTVYAGRLYTEGL